MRDDVVLDDAGVRHTITLVHRGRAWARGGAGYFDAHDRVTIVRRHEVRARRGTMDRCPTGSPGSTTP